jgi:hypothetical protein
MEVFIIPNNAMHMSTLILIVDYSFACGSRCDPGTYDISGHIGDVKAKTCTYTGRKRTSHAIQPFALFLLGVVRREYDISGHIAVNTYNTSQPYIIGGCS